MNVNNLKLLRNLYGITQRQFALMLKMNRTSICDWENSQKRMSEASLYKVSTFFDIDPEYIYEKELTQDIKNKVVKAGRKQNCNNETTDVISLFTTAVNSLLNGIESLDVKKLEILYMIIKVIERKIVKVLETKDQEENESVVFELLDELNNQF